MPRNPAVVKACQRRKVERAKAYVTAIRAKTVCTKCGGQPVEWHNPDHEKDPRYRIANMVRKGMTAARIQAEINRSTAVCRRCHMALDGRAKNLVDAFQDWRMSLTAEQRSEWARKASRARVAKLPPKQPKARRIPRIPFPDVRTGPRPRETFSNAKLDTSDVQAIRREFRGGRKGNRHELAAKYGVTVNMISKIVTGACWKSVA